MFILSELFVQIQHARWEIIFLNCINIFEIEFKCTVKFTLLDCGCADTADSLIHKRFELILNVILKKFLCLNSHFKDSFFQIIEVQIFYNVNSCLYVRIDESFVNVGSSFFDTSLSMFEWNF